MDTINSTLSIPLSLIFILSPYNLFNSWYFFTPLSLYLPYLPFIRPSSFPLSIIFPSDFLTPSLILSPSSFLPPVPFPLFILLTFYLPFPFLFCIPLSLSFPYPHLPFSLAFHSFSNNGTDSACQTVLKHTALSLYHLYSAHST